MIRYQVLSWRNGGGSRLGMRRRLVMAGQVIRHRLSPPSSAPFQRWDRGSKRAILSLLSWWQSHTSAERPPTPVGDAMVAIMSPEEQPTSSSRWLSPRTSHRSLIRRLLHGRPIAAAFLLRRALHRPTPRVLGGRFRIGGVGEPWSSDLPPATRL